jgi:hypothetical protein
MVLNIEYTTSYLYVAHNTHFIIKLLGNATHIANLQIWGTVLLVHVIYFPNISYPNPTILVLHFLTYLFTFFSYRKFNCVVKRMAAVQTKKGTTQPDPGKKLKNECASSKEVNSLLAAITTKSGSTPKVVKEAFRSEPNSSDLDTISVDSDQSTI